MRTLNRPMFNMGGPIKQGIMHGIREPYAGGGRAALVGNPVYPKTGGREHHAIPLLAPLLAGMARFAAPAFGRFVTSQIPRITRLKTLGKGKNLRFARTKSQPTKFDITGGRGRKRIYEKNIMDQEKFVPYKFWANDPLYKAAVGSKGIAGKAIRGTGKLIKGATTTPTGLAITGATTYGFWPDGTKKTTEELIEDNVVRGDKDYGPYTKGKQTQTAAQIEAKAKADKEKRINALLDTMGYDKARKNAAYDALIDAGRMVSERGTLDPKNIGRELIDPIVATTSARFDKPEQIREAVGLMQVKADIAKQMEDPQIKELRAKQIAQADKTLAGPDFKEVITNKIIKGEAPSGGTLAQILRATEGIDAVVLPIKIDPNKDPLTVATETIKETWTNPEKPRVDPGYYVVSDRVIIVDEQGNVTPYL
jgi:hypothetical protein